MRLTLEQRTDLALRAVLLLDDERGGARAKDLAPRLHTTVQYLPHVLRPLVQAGWVQSEPGPTGGYRLVTDLSRVSLLDLIELMEGTTDSRTCVLRRGPCGQADFCALHVPWLDAREKLLESLSRVPVVESRRKESENE